MSGGAFQYKQYALEMIADEIEQAIDNNGKPREKSYSGEVEYYPEFDERTLAEFRKAVRLLREAQVYAQRIDWLLSSDDSEDSFHTRLARDLKELRGEG